ncbi:hypothetical protein B0H10DRAFT_2019667 [Mycena sp. CBHHK59/15]|nr:hypothetical protein B0H10DRAFT_2019667 [Mycena sp. CBHHK59/15]
MLSWSLYLPLFALSIPSIAGLGFQPPQSPSLAHRTNAERLSSGAPLMRPKRLFGSPVFNAARSAPSGTSFPIDSTQKTQTGYLGLFGVDGTFLGFYQTPGAALVSSVTTKRSGSTTSYTFDTPVDTAGLFEICLAEATSYRLAGIGWSAALSLGSGHGSYVQLTLAGVSTAAGSPPYANLYETTIYSIDDTTGQLAPNWVNPTGTKPTVYFMWSPTRMELVFTGDTTAAKSDFISDEGYLQVGTGLGDDAVEVTLYFGSLADWSAYL